MRELKPGPVSLTLLLCALAMVIAAARFHTYSQPLDRDPAMYAGTAAQLLRGNALYRDCIDNKPPGIFVTYAVAECLAGYTRKALYLLNAGSSILAMLAIFYAASAPPFGRTAGCWAAAAWALIGGDLYLEGNMANTEVFINLFVAAGLGVLLRVNPKGIDPGKAILAGGCFALATFYKHHVAVIPISLCAASVLTPLPDRKRAWSLAEAALIGCVIGAGWIGLYAYFAATGRADDFVSILFTYNRAYAGSLSRNLFAGLQIGRLFASQLCDAWPLALGLAAACGFAWKNRARWAVGWLIFWAVGSAAAIALPGKFFSHYYQLWLPLLTVGTGWGLAWWAGAEGAMGRVGKWAGCALTGLLLSLQIPNYARSPDDWSITEHGSIFVRTRNLAQRIDRMLKMDETFFLFGCEPEIYWEAHRIPPRMQLGYAMLGMLEERGRKIALEDLEREKPPLFVVQDWAVRRFGLDEPILQWCHRSYEAPPTDEEEPPFFLTVRRGSDLQRRWHAGM